MDQTDGRAAAIAQARDFFDGGGFAALLARMVAIPSTSQDPAHRPALDQYLQEGILPWLDRLGFRSTIHPNPVAGLGPILTATRIEDPARPTVLLYGHGDTVSGLDAQWSEGLSPWQVVERDGRWYGRGTADNKGQHLLNLAALEAVLAVRGGRLGANVKLVLEMSEERGSLGLRDGRVDLLAVLVVPHAHGRVAVAAALARAHAHNVGVDGARDAVVDLEVQLGQRVLCGAAGA